MVCLPIAHAQAPETTEAPVSIEQQALETHASNIANAIYGAEGRCHDLHGESGEYGCYQYLSSTWKAYSMEVAGEVLVQTPENERYVTVQKIVGWIEQGISDRGIFLIWNQGSAAGWGGGTDCYAGVNKWGVSYDSCDYAQRALDLLNR